MHASNRGRDLPKNLREARVALGLVQEQLAAALQVRQGEVSKWERGRRPRRGTRERLALFLRVPIETVESWWPDRHSGKVAA